MRKDEIERAEERQPPDLQAVIEAHGGYHLITPEAWQSYEQALAQWRDKHRFGDFYR